MQHEVVKVVIPLIVSSEITSSPPVAPIISSIPRSKRSYFFISKEYGDSFFEVSVYYYETDAAVC
jgi:hypothetical protein